MAYPSSRGMREEDTWQGTCIMGQQGVWMHYYDMIILFSLHQLYDGGMMRQQRPLLLWRIKRGQGKSCSHILHDVAMGGNGNIMGGYFDIEHVRECIYELAGAYLHGPTMLSLWGMSLMMECSQDHFIFDTLGGPRGGEIDRVVDGLIGCCGMFSLTWMSKHKKEDFHGACDSFLFILVCHTTMEDSYMDLATILLPSHGKNYIFALIDFSTQYLYTLTISL